MDPLSITSSTITLIQAAGAVSSALYEFVATFRNADTRVASLCTQLSRLIRFLEAVDRTLRKCRGPLSLASMDEDLWRQSALSLEDCKTTLEELSIFINRIKAAAKSPGLFRRARVAMDLTMYAGDITGFEEKIHKSNWALQTMLSAIQVSLSLRGNETQDKILYELGRLKSSIEQSIQASFHHSDGFSHMLEDPSDARVAYNLQKLARAAQNFHSSASSTASTRESSSTIYGTNGNSFWNVQLDSAMSIRGGPSLTPNKRQQIDQFVKQQRRMTLRRQRKPLQHVPSSAAASVVRPCTPEPAPAVSSEESQETESNMSETADDHDEVDDEAEFQSFLLSGLEEVAKDSMLNQEFAKAQAMLEEAIQRRTGSTSEDAEFKQLQIQLATCYFFQHKWQLAEPLIDSIAKSKANFDPVVCNLLHALAIANAVEKRFGKAITVCKQALQGKRRLKQDFGDTSEKECNETLGLLATIHDLHGNRLDAEALRRKLSNGFSYYHPENELEFIVSHPKLCTEVFGKKISLDWRRPQIAATNIGAVAELMADLPKNSFLSPIKEDDTPKNSKTSKKPLQTFHTKLSLYERLNMDSAKEVAVSSSLPALTSDENSENSPDETPAPPPDEIFSTWWSDASSGSSFRPGMSPKRPFTRRIARFFGTRRGRATMPEDNWSTSPFSDSEDMSSPARPKSAKGFWTKSDSQIFKLKKLNTRLRKKTSDEADSNSFSFLRAVDRPWRHGIDASLRWSSSYRRPSNYPYFDVDDLSVDDLQLDCFRQTNHWVPASEILQESMKQSHLPPAELEDTSMVMFWSSPFKSGERSYSNRKSQRFPGYFDLQAGARPFVPPSDFASPVTRLASRMPLVPQSPGDSQVPVGTKISPRRPSGLLFTKALHEEMTRMVSFRKRADKPVLTGGPVRSEKPEWKTNTSSLRAREEIDLNCPPLATSRVPNLTIAIPRFGERSEGIPLVAHHPAKPLVPATPQSTGFRPEILFTSTMTADPRTHARKQDMAKVLSGFKDNNMDELAVRQKQDRDFDEAMRKEAQGLSVGKSGGRQAWVPAAFFKDLSPIPAAVEGSVASASRDSKEQGLGVKKEESLVSSEIDYFSRAFHDVAARATREGTSGHDLSTPSYQLVDGGVRERMKSQIKPESAKECPSMTNLLARENTQLSDQRTSAPKTQVDSGSTSPSLPSQQLGRKFSWETVFEEDSISGVPTEKDPKSVPPPLSQLNILNRKFSWISDETSETPDLVRSSSSSSCSSSSTSSTSSAFTSVSSTSNGPMLKFGSAMKELLIVGNDSTSSLAEPRNQDDFLEQLSVGILDRKSQRCSTKTLPLMSKMESEVKAKQGNEPSSVDTKGSAEPAKSLQVKLLACEKLQALPFIRPTDIVQRMMEEEEREREKNAATNPTEGMLNRRHPLRAKRKNRKIKREAAVDEEKRMPYPDGVSSSGALSIGIAI